MNATAWVVRLAATPSPTPVEVPLSEQASPGVLGFLVTFAVAVAAILLALSLTRHLRVVDRRAAQLARDEDAVLGAAEPDADEDDPEGGADGSGGGRAGGGAGGPAGGRPGGGAGA
ncbi:hypothetical protein [Cellulomonas cellasea]|uniref:Uncharacterized protein n=2 Tax=Cellulomonas cellasea TaxID=43670 RepID=A0A4Y3KZ12_9CELL|nr:hypothetical protein [Cellulomonas cellasea]GEA89629.1 hypothetical protein CCE01nite_35780 [Cellulomonas cellasea]